MNINARNITARLGIQMLFWFLAIPSVGAISDTIPDLTKQTQRGDWLRLPSGKVVWVEMLDTEDESDEFVDAGRGLESSHRRSNPASCVTSNFAGVVRKNAKTIPHKGWAKSFATLDKLVGWLPSDSLMAHHEPPIRGGSDSKRVAEERRNVKIKRAWLLGVYREEDNDFHAVLCNRSKYDNTALLFSIEVSGLPERSSVSRCTYRKLENARKKLISRLGDLRCGNTFLFPQNGLPVQIKGSLFFDSQHAGQTHGRKGLNPNSAWEIHPVTKIKWLD
ncbi:MAG: hypothetical protein H7246_15730 [Phycisphaerae bacterium]|nr:hypothetical protein [Saprospiraceae bacterium]